MKEFVEKLIGRLEEYPTYSFGVSLLNTQEYIKVSDLIEIVNQLAEEYNNESVKGDLISRSALLEMLEDDFCADCKECARKPCRHNDIQDFINNQPTVRNDGWIPCSERLPSKEGEYLTFVEYDDDEFIAIDEFLCEGILKEWNCTPNYRVIAWMELPEKYKEKNNGSS